MTDEKIIDQENLNDEELDKVSGGYYDQDVENIEMRRKQKEEMEKEEREAERKKELEKAGFAHLKFMSDSLNKSMKSLKDFYSRKRK